MVHQVVAKEAAKAAAASVPVVIGAVVLQEAVHQAAGSAQAVLLVAAHLPMIWMTISRSELRPV